ncbi:hypothetical protein [Mesorhizobium sp. M1365]|uniref:hypothetical protein n=1 Tax=Mesorhizobium sp. M1365 TaxID=2957090 RepID=UPI00333B05A6
MQTTLPENNLNYPVHISGANGSGSGFFLNGPDASWLVTAKHVLFEQDGTLSHPSIVLTFYTSKLSHQFTIKANLVKLQAKGYLLSHATADVAALKLGEIVDGNFTVYFDFDCKPDVIITGINLMNITSIGHAGLSNDIFLFGYPESIGEKGQLEPFKPLLRRGCIAGFNSVNRTIIVDAPAYQGNSGGLVLEARRINPILVKYLGLGVVSQFVPFIEETVSRHFGTVNVSIENSGYTIVEPMDKVFELIGSPMP